MLFSELGLTESVLKAVTAEGYTSPTPIQEGAIPHIIAGRDLLGTAQTGTGKTAAFALPILHRLITIPDNQNGYYRPRVLVLSPTRELATQIGDSFYTYGNGSGMRHVTIYGGVSQVPQVKMLRRGVDIIIATPGRLLDLVNQGHVQLESIETFVLDEADRMLDMGFMPDIRRIIDMLPDTRQTLLFSATMPPAIERLSNELLRNPADVRIAPKTMTTDLVTQSVFHVERGNKPTALASYLTSQPVERAVVFTRTKQAAERVCIRLCRAGISADAIHGNKTQNARQRTLAAFRANRITVLVATDVASRGLDVDGVSHVVNYDLPMEAETYVHRIGRTGRAGASGVAMSFVDREQRSLLGAIERLLRKKIPVQNIDLSEPKSVMAVPAVGPEEAQQISQETPSTDSEFERPRREFRDRSESRGYEGSRDRGDRPRYGDRSQGGRSEGGRSEGGRRFGGGDRPRYGDRPQGGRSYGGRPEGRRFDGDRPRPYRENAGDNAASASQGADARPEGGDQTTPPQTERRFERRPQGERYGSQRDGQDRRGGNRDNAGGDRRPRYQGGAGGERRPRYEGGAGGQGGERRPRYEGGAGGQGGERRPRYEGGAGGQGGERRPRYEGGAGGQGGERRPRYEGGAGGQGGERRPRYEGGAGGQGGERRPRYENKEGRSGGEGQERGNRFGGNRTGSQGTYGQRFGGNRRPEGGRDGGREGGRDGKAPPRRFDGQGKSGGPGKYPRRGNEAAATLPPPRRTKEEQGGESGAPRKAPMLKKRRKEGGSGPSGGQATPRRYD